MIHLKRTFITSLIFIFFLTGCAGTNEEAKNQEQKPDKVVQVNDPTHKKDTEMSSQEIAEHIAHIATTVPNVNDATAVVAGPYAVVGIDVDGDLDRSRVGSIKYSVAESLQHDPYGRYAVVVADPDAFTRLTQMGNQIRQGEPGRGFMEELAGIVGRIMPQVPSDIKTTEDPTEQNEKQLSNNEGEELDQIQNKQSKGNLGNQ